MTIMWIIGLLPTIAVTPANDISYRQGEMVSLHDVKQIAAGDAHTCILTNVGKVQCWGWNYAGQLGDGTQTDRTSPVDVIGLNNNVIAITSGSNHTCALLDAGGVRCWGNNYDGQLGDNHARFDSSTPVNVSMLNNGVNAITAGSSHTCAFLNNNVVKCWGDNSYGQLGNGSTIDSATPVDVIVGSDGVTAIAAGSNHTCLRTTLGGLRCWGLNSNGQLGDGTMANRSAPVDALYLTTPVIAIAAGKSHTCVITTNNDARCWGAADYGQLGNGTVEPSLTPVIVAGLEGGVASIRAGNGRTCAVLSNGAAKCWGDNYYGELGDGTHTTRLVPVDVVGLNSDVVSITTGENHTCALKSDNRVQCWGWNKRGQLGIGKSSIHLKPESVVNLSAGVAHLIGGGSHTCATLDDGSVKCWGLNNGGQLGDGTAVKRTLPVDVINLDQKVTALAAGYLHTCGLTTNKGIKCWGANGYGQLGDNTTIARTTPIDVIDMTTNVIAVTAGGNHTCGLTTAGGVKCWGDNYWGQIGDGTTMSRTVPVDVVGLTTDVVGIAAGIDHTCALLNNGAIQCWGRNDNRQLGDNTAELMRLTPVAVVGLPDAATKVTAGGLRTCALTSNSGVVCWGYYAGDTPQAIPGLYFGVAAITIGSGSSHICVLKVNGSTKCWGINNQGQLGDGTTTNRTTPTDVIDLATSVSAITSGDSHTCAIQNGGVKCWGRNEEGQLGDGAAWSLVPVTVQTLTTTLPTSTVTNTPTDSAINTPTPTVTPTPTSNRPPCPWNAQVEPVISPTDRLSQTIVINGVAGAAVKVVTGWGTFGAVTATPYQVPITLLPNTVHTLTVTVNHNRVGGSPPTLCIETRTHDRLGAPLVIVQQSATGTPTATPTPTLPPTATPTATAGNTPTATPSPTLTATPTRPRASEGDDYETDNTCAQARAIAANGSLYPHTFHTEADTDWVQFPVVAGAEYLIEVAIPPTSPADVVLELYDACDQLPLAGQDYAFTPAVRLRFKASATGAFWLQLFNHERSVAGAHVHYELAVRNLSEAGQPGAAIIVAGKIRSADPVEENIYQVTNAARQLFIDHGYTDDRIYYLAPDLQANVDALATAANLEAAITAWAVDKVGPDRALTLYLMDHGDRGYFFLDKQRSEWVTPEQVHQWLTVLETKAPGVKINVIIEACYAGSFIRAAQSLSKPGRVIITSTDNENLAWASRQGAQFSDHLLAALRRGESLYNSFRAAQSAARIANGGQQPWLDGDGNGHPEESSDGLIAAQRGFAFAGTLPNEQWPPYIAQVQPPGNITNGRGQVRADVRDDLKVTDVWAIIYPPSYVAPTTGEALVQETLDTIKLLDQGNGWYGAAYPGFTEMGVYRIVVFAEDGQRMQAQPVAITVETGRQLFLPLITR
jgi:alpha-tubulin suppressor-like RCC1 family protein